MWNPFAGGKPAPQLEALARLVEVAFWEGVHRGAVWGFVAGAVVGVALTLWLVRTQRQ